MIPSGAGECFINRLGAACYHGYFKGIRLTRAGRNRSRLPAKHSAVGFTPPSSHLFPLCFTITFHKLCSPNFVLLNIILHGQGCKTRSILPSRMAEHGVSLENMGNMENLENMENMEMFSSSPTESFSVSPTEVFYESLTPTRLNIWITRLEPKHSIYGIYPLKKS